MARILIIDDDDDLRAMLRMTLFQYGHTIIEACNGKVGLELFEQVNADLVITDILMPETEGLDVVMTLHKKRPPVKIIAISGGGRQGSMNFLKAAKLLGADKVLAKPFSCEALMAAVNALVPPYTAPELLLVPA